VLGESDTHSANLPTHGSGWVTRDQSDCLNGPEVEFDSVPGLI